MSQIKLSDKQTLAWSFLEDKITNELLYGGGAGGGKSYLGCIWHIYRRTTYPESRGLIGRAKLSNLEESTLNTLFTVANIMGYRQGVDFNYNSQKHIITWSNGSKSICKDLFAYPSDPDFISLGSTEFTDAFIDEATEITLKAFEIVTSRIRWKLDEYGLVPKVLITGNPGEGWVKERFIIKDNAPVNLQPYQKFIQSLVTENPDTEFAKLYMQQLERLSSDYDKARLLYGDWEANREILNPFAIQFDKIKHTSKLPQYDIRKQLTISIDFNLNPFACTFHHIWRDAEGDHHHCFNEVGIEKGSIPAMIDYIKSKYYHSLPNCILTGDAMGNRGDISQRDNASLYVQLLRGLGLRESQLKVAANPTHENSRADVNYYLYHYPDFKLHSEYCKGSIQDFETVQCDAFGSILKRDRKDLSQRADFLDTHRYIINSVQYKWIEFHQKVNRPVNNSFQKNQ